jgi:transposase
MHLMRQRAELLAHLPQTNSHYNLPEISKKLAYKANRAWVAERFPDPAVQQSLAMELAPIDTDDHLLTKLELALIQTVKAHEAQTCYCLCSIPGVGKILALVLLYEIQEIRRVPRVQDVVSSCRLVTCAKESAGKRYGTSGKKIGHAYLKWACSEAAGLGLCNHPASQTSLARLTKTHGKGKALTVLAQT